MEINKRIVDSIFVEIVNSVDMKYRDECNMIIDVFLEEEYTVDELKRMYLFLLDKVKDDKKEKIIMKIEQNFGSLSKEGA